MPSRCRCGRKAADTSVEEEARPRGRTGDGLGHARYRSIVAARSSFREAIFCINAMFALVVRFGNTSSPCERWAHERKFLWDPERTQPTSTLIHRLHGRVAGLRGDGTDEPLLHALHSEIVKQNTPGEATRV